MNTSKITDGNHILAEAMRQIHPDVVAAYPITPASHVVERFSQFVANGEVQTEFVPCESEHAAMSACVGAAAAGVRVMTATASQGLALMHEVLFNASGLRLPIVLFNGNRALSAPLSIHGDHSDAMAQRDTGWIQLYAKSPQEAYDLAIQAFKIAEHETVRTPVMVCFDAFETSHLVTKNEILSDEVVTKFLGEPIQINPLFDLEKPVTYGTSTKPDFYFECRRSQHEGLEQSMNQILSVGKQYEQLSGRDFSNHFEMMEIADAETVLVILGSAAGTVSETIKNLREKGEKVGMLRLRTFRPFPGKEIVEALSHVKHIAVLDRTMPSGAMGGPVFNELSAAFFQAKSQIQIKNYIYGIGQRDFLPVHVEEIFHSFPSKNQSPVTFINIRD